MITRRQLIGGLAVAGVVRALGAPPRAEAEPPPETRRLRLVQTPSMCQAPQYVAEDLFRTEGFDVEYVRKEGPQDIVEALASGEADVNLHFSARLVAALDRGAPLLVLAGVHPGCFELFTAQPLRSLRDLKGKTVSIRAVGGPEHVFLTSMAAYVGLEPAKDITWVTHPVPKAIELLARGEIDAFLGFPPNPQELRARKIGHVLFNSSVDRPWSQYFCCMVAAHREFVRKHPVATKRALRAILKATDVCAVAPDRASRELVDRGRTRSYNLVRQVLKEVPYDRWRDYNPEDTLRFYSLRLREAGMITSTPQKIIAEGTDWRFLNELKKELKG